MNSDKSDQIDTQPQTSKKSSQKKERSTKRMEKHRQKRGQEVQHAFKEELEKKYSFDSLISSKLVHSVTSSIPIPVSTRGLGFAIVDHFEAARLANINIRITATQAFRVSHAQLYVKASQLRPTYLPNDTAPEINRLYLDEETREVLKRDSNFSIVAELINSYGNVDRHQCNFVPQLISPPILAFAQAPEHTYMFPDPFNVNYVNLRDIVASLANPLVPVAERQFFRAHNPIPGALWNADHTLANPLDIWPNDYDADQLAQDVSQVAMTLVHVQRKKPNWVGKIDTSSSSGGKCSILATLSKQTPGTWRIEKLAPASPDSIRQQGLYLTSSSPMLEDMDLFLSNLHFLGECPPAGIVGLYPQRYGFRDTTIHGQSAQLSRTNLVTQVL